MKSISNSWIFQENYPKNLKKEAWLNYYEKELGFNALEVNYTYYTLPSSRSLKGMDRKTV